jgi:hypothetical protein
MSVNLNSVREKLGDRLTTANLPNAALYVPGTVAWDWESCQFFAPKPEGDYERMLDAFLSREWGGEWPGENVLVLIGGIGTGKTTALHRLKSAIGRDAICAECRGAPACKPVLITIDFLDVSENATDQLFWTHVSEGLKLLGSPSIERLSLSDEIGPFWTWLCATPGFAEHSPPIAMLRELVGPLAAALHSGGDGFQQTALQEKMLSARMELVRSSEAIDLAWYELAKLRFSLLTKRNKCKGCFLFLDNIDQLAPTRQREAAEFAMTAARLLRARSIVAVRPLTWHVLSHGQLLVHHEEHYGPAPSVVLRSRIDSAKGVLADEEWHALDSLYRTVVGFGGLDTKGLPVAFHATCGLGVRFALRNFENMLESPHLTAVSQKLDDVPLSLLATAFFHGSGQALAEQCFEDLYSVEGPQPTELTVLLKPRILDMIGRVTGGRLTHGKLLAWTKRFGYQQEDVVIAMDQMMEKTRPLVWSESGLRFSAADVDDLVAITPLGNGYREKLFGELIYEQARLRIATLDVPLSPLRAVYEFHQYLTEVDLKEVEQVVATRDGMRFYTRLYGLPDEASVQVPCLSYVHAGRLVASMESRLQYRERDPNSLPQWFDVGRPNEVRNKLIKIIKKARRKHSKGIADLLT